MMGGTMKCLIGLAIGALCVAQVSFGAPGRTDAGRAAKRKYENACAGNVQRLLSDYVAGNSRNGIRDHGEGLLLVPWSVAIFPTMAVVAADTTEPEKKRVPKKEEKTHTKKATATDEDHDDHSSCFDCLGGFFGALWLSSDDDEPEVAPSGFDDTTEPVPGILETPFDARIDPANPAANDVTVWDTPGGRMSNASIVGNAALGDEVTVTDRTIAGGAWWARIVTRSSPVVAGWVPENNITTGTPEPRNAPSNPMSGQATVASQPSGPVLDPTDQRWEFPMNIGVSVFTEGKLNEEYKGSLSLGVAARGFLLHAFHVNTGVSVDYANGEPPVNYVIGSVTESPENSHFYLWGFHLGLGQLYRLPSPQWFLLWEFAPAAFYVREVADIIVFQSNSVVERREEKLSEWVGGFQGRIEVGHIIDTFAVAGYLDFSISPWHSNREKSLTFDFLDKDHLVKFSLGITLGVTVF